MNEPHRTWNIKPGPVIAGIVMIALGLAMYYQVAIFSGPAWPKSGSFMVMLGVSTLLWGIFAGWRPRFRQ